MAEKKDTQAFEKRIDEIRDALLAAFGQPVWRTPLPPVDELVSTILSQNTNDVNRDKAFDSLKESFLTWEEVMAADKDEVIEAVRIAGLANQKGPRIQKALL
jgi:endonuclease-3